MSATSQTAVEALAAYLIERDWPSAVDVTASRRAEYRRRAAAILNGEAWAIRMTWPEAAYDIKTWSSR